MAAVVMCLWPAWASLRAVFCSPWIKLHDAETLGGQTGDSTLSAVRDGEKTPGLPFPGAVSSIVPKWQVAAFDFESLVLTLPPNL